MKIDTYFKNKERGVLGTGHVRIEKEEQYGSSDSAKTKIYPKVCENCGTSILGKKSGDCDFCGESIINIVDISEFEKVKKASKVQFMSNLTTKPGPVHYVKSGKLLCNGKLPTETTTAIHLDDDATGEYCRKCTTIKSGWWTPTEE